MRRGVERLNGGEVGAAASLAVGYLAEWVHLPLTMPLEVRAAAPQPPHRAHHCSAKRCGP